jgi:hypothetical protein
MLFLHPQTHLQYIHQQYVLIKSSLKVIVCDRIKTKIKKSFYLAVKVIVY